MPKPTNPLTAISKKLETFKAKSQKLAQEIADLSKLVAAQAAKTTPSISPAAKKPVAKKAPAKAQGVPKKRGKTAKVKIDEKSISKLTVLNKDSADKAMPKKMGRPFKK